MFKNFSSLDHRSIFLVYYYRPYFRKKKKKKKKKKHFFRPHFQRFAPDIPIENKTKQNKTKTKPFKVPIFHLTSHSSTPLDFAQCQRGNLLSARGGTCSVPEGELWANVVIGKDWHMNKNLKSQNYQQFYFGIMYASCSWLSEELKISITIR